MNLVILYGIGRNNRITEKHFKLLINSYNTNKLKVEVNYYYLEIGKIENPRSNEFQKLPDVGNKPFNANKFFKFKKQDLNISYYFNMLKSSHDLYNDKFKSYENLLFQLSLLKKVYDNTDFSKYKSICFVRDDILFSKTLNIKSMMLFVNNFSFISAWSWYNGYNDRFFFTNSQGAEIFSNRMINLEGFLHKFNYIQGEELLKFSLKSKKIKLLVLPTRTTRVRSNGQLVKEDNLIWNLFYTKNFFELITLILKSLLYLNLKNGKTFIHNMGKGTPSKKRNTIRDF